MHGRLERCPHRENAGFQHHRAYSFRFRTIEAGSRTGKEFVKMLVMDVRTWLVLSLLSCVLRADEVRVPWVSSRIQGSPDAPAKYKLTRAFSGIAFTNPVDLAFSADLGRWLLAEQGGKIFAFNPRGEEVYLAADFRPLQGPEGAFYGFTFDPHFASNRFFYACYALKSDLPDGTHVSRFKVTNEREPKIDLKSEEGIITWLSGGHNGGCLKFGTDGFLYISTGDAAGPNPPDPLKTGQ